MKGHYLCMALTNDSKSTIRAGMDYRVWAAPVYGSDDTAFLVETPQGDIYVEGMELFLKHFKVVYL